MQRPIVITFDITVSCTKIKLCIWNKFSLLLFLEMLVIYFNMLVSVVYCFNCTNYNFNPIHFVILFNEIVEHDSFLHISFCDILLGVKMTSDIPTPRYGMVCQLLSNGLRGISTVDRSVCCFAGKVVRVHALPERCGTTAQSRYCWVPAALSSPEHCCQHVPLRLDHWQLHLNQWHSSHREEELLPGDV